jgi:hypothetical protein
MRIAQAVAEIVADIRIERQLALLDHFHGAERGHESSRPRRRGTSVASSIGLGRAWRGGQALAAELLAVDDFAMADRHHGQAGQRHRRVVTMACSWRVRAGGLLLGQGRGHCGTGGNRQSG